ncbi:MAG TPA: hypothetical protein VFW46_21820 [Stellaceae bacterium]|nr:hypothetical protein [Stellaceae bacterium]
MPGEARVAASNLRFHDPDNKFEKSFWGDCTNTFFEEQKHFVYARMMGIARSGRGFDAGGKRILDIGGGPVSMLLKADNLPLGMVCDPILYPDWVIARYAAKGIVFLNLPGEELRNFGWDEVWIYNVLQHTRDPARIIENAYKAAPVIRLFEWIDIPPHQGHPQMLTEAGLTKWLGSEGKTVALDESGCRGNSFSGVFERVLADV